MLSMSSKSSTNKLYWYEILLQAIEVFSTKFNVEQLANYSLDFANEILTLNQSALYLKRGEHYIPIKMRLYSKQLPSIPDSAALHRIATFHGEVIRAHFDHFFQQTDIEQLEMQLVIPLIIDDFLFGFIVSNGKATGDFGEDDFSIANTLMKLMNNSLENSRHYADLQVTNSELNKKIFNLFAINQSTKALLSEVKLEKLFAIATDVFSEVSSSRITSFGIYDGIAQKIKIKGYRNVESFQQFYAEFKLRDTSYQHNKVVLRMDEDRELIQSIFVNWEDFEQLNANYIVLIVKDQILGFVTLSDSVNDVVSYDSSMFELIESLASATYIAIHNAMLFEELMKKKELIERKFNTLATLNRLIKNINHCEEPDELCSLTLKTLSLSFGVSKAFICFQQDAQSTSRNYRIEHEIGLDIEKGYSFELPTTWDGTIDGETIAHFTTDAVTHYISDPELLQKMQEGNCLVISPITIGHSEWSLTASLPQGFLVIAQTKENLREEEVLLMDTVAKNISPILHQMQITRDTKSSYKEDTRKKLIADLQEKLEDRALYQVEFHLYYRKVQKHPFDDREEDYMYQELPSYLIDQYLFVISYEPLADPMLQEIIIYHRVEELYEYSFV
ncbi:GAF domain-containing protein [Brevibacillus ginsengisoli]|uniref:GAF domain-containing protein n=1 Tax=Brevibacillus ginsengisoli TaxID=363854 RepID=UPI003CE8A4BE